MLSIVTSYFPLPNFNLFQSVCGLFIKLQIHNDQRLENFLNQLNINCQFNFLNTMNIKSVHFSSTHDLSCACIDCNASVLILYMTTILFLYRYINNNNKSFSFEESNTRHLSKFISKLRTTFSFTLVCNHSELDTFYKRQFYLANKCNETDILS